ncbi:MAG: arginine--tRNA ligase [Candidatus Omnitrophota bacterium]|nr:arginine--tRNA ligase [Candidatus Omnitrophota bacterium]
MLYDLQDTIQKAISETVKKEFSKDCEPLLEVPNDPAHGDASSNIAFQLASELRKPPVIIANIIQEKLIANFASYGLRDKIKSVEVKPPGFINFFFSETALFAVAEKILKQRHNFGRQKIGGNKKIQLEFVSANPTGTLSVAHGRQAAVGDALANILEFLGYKVTREYYVNDEGTQIDILGQSIQYRLKEILGEEVVFPENGYQGEYIYDIAKDILQNTPAGQKGQIKDKDLKFFSQYGVKYILKTIMDDLKDFSVDFDIWSRQSEITKKGSVKKVLDLLRSKGFVYDSEGAVWFKSTHFGDDKDRVVIKSDGSFTYLAPDIAYHKNKFDRGFKWVINIWGPDHHGYIPRLKAAVVALGKSADSLSVIIVQLATLFKEGKPVSMSTRRGQYISLREVIDEVGKDAGRFFFLMRRTDSHLDFDLELAKKQSSENPVYYIQYAHARISSILSNAQKQRLKKTNPHLLKAPEELGILRQLASFPQALLSCQKLLDPFSLVNYLQELAAGFHKFYDRNRVLTEDKELTAVRLALVEAVKIVLSTGLNLLGITVPAKM